RLRRGAGAPEAIRSSPGPAGASGGTGRGRLGGGGGVVRSKRVGAPCDGRSPAGPGSGRRRSRSGDCSTLPDTVGAVYGGRGRVPGRRRGRASRGRESGGRYGADLQFADAPQRGAVAGAADAARGVSGARRA